jgi:hypothetical protein
VDKNLERLNRNREAMKTRWAVIVLVAGAFAAGVMVGLLHGN